MDQLNSIYYIFFIAGLLLTFAILASKLSSIFGTPLLLLFLAIGMLTGEDGIFINIHYDDYNSAYFFANFMLALIILDGGLRTNFSTFKRVATESTILATVGVLVTASVTGIIAYYCLGNISIIQALLLGSIVGSTDAGAVFSLLGGNDVSLKSSVSSTLQIESATNDPMAILLTTVMLAIISGQSTSWLESLIIFAMQFGLGIVFGVIFGFIGRFIIASMSIGSGLYALLVFGIGLIGFSVTAAMGGSGFLAIFIIGMMVGNQNIRQISYILPVAEGITWLCQISLFLMLGLLVSPHQMLNYIVEGVVVAVAITFIARPLAVFLCVKPFFRAFTNRDLFFMSWVGLRGSVPIVLAIYPVFANIENPQLYFNVAFVVVIVSLLVQGATLNPVSRLFKVYAPSSAMPVTKANVGIKLANDYELYNYRIRNESMEGLSLRNIHFPKGTMIAGMFRDGHMIKTVGNTVLRHGDILSIIGTDNDEPLLNSMFSKNITAKQKLIYNGDKIFDGSIMMSDLADKYKIELTDYERGLNVSEFMSYHIGGFAQTGDMVNLINVVLVVASLNGDEIASVGLYLASESAQAFERQRRQQLSALRRNSIKPVSATTIKPIAKPEISSK
ncbi:MAG: potassium/proton antiporter [Succinatimonas sp.]|nr:potassium/proton antiporter [Succinatimonas sp.]